MAEYPGWNMISLVANVTSLSRCSTWNNQLQQELQSAAGGSSRNFSCSNYSTDNFALHATALKPDIISTRPPVQEHDVAKNSNDEVDSRTQKRISPPVAFSCDDPRLIYSADQALGKAAAVISKSSFATSHALPAQQHYLSSSGSSQMSDHLKSTNISLINGYFVDDYYAATNSINMHKGDRASVGLSADSMSCYAVSSDEDIFIPALVVSSRKRKAAELEEGHYANSLPVIRADAVPLELMKFNDKPNRGMSSLFDQNELKFGSNSTEQLDYSSSSAEGPCGFKLIPARKARKEMSSEKSQQLPSSSNINFELQAISSADEALPPDAEAIAEMKEIMYRAAAFRPVYLGVDDVVEKPKRRNVRISSDPQTSAARERREKISERIRVLQRIVPGGNKMDTATMLDEAANYLKFLRSQVKALEKTAGATSSFGFNFYNFLQ